MASFPQLTLSWVPLGMRNYFKVYFNGERGAFNPEWEEDEIRVVLGVPDRYLDSCKAAKRALRRTHSSSGWTQDTWVEVSLGSLPIAGPENWALTTGMLLVTGSHTGAHGRAASESPEWLIYVQVSMLCSEPN